MAHPPISTESFAAALATITAGRTQQFEHAQAIAEDVIEGMANLGWLGAHIPAEFGGTPLDAYAMGHLCEAVGAESGSLLSLLTVHSMVSFAVARWGSKAQRAEWLPALACGKLIGAFALTEPEAGSDAHAGTATLRRDGDTLVLDGTKKWISFAQRADVFLVVAKLDGKLTAVLVPRHASGLTVRPIQDMYGFRAAMLGEVQFQQCRIPASNLIGNPDFGLSQIVGSVLNEGRYCIAWGGAGLTRACVEASLAYARQRHQFGQPLGEHQLIQRQLADMAVQSRAARLMCLDAAHMRSQGDPAMIMATIEAKYFAAMVAERIASDAAQLHGANGLSADYPVQRYLRDAKVLGLIEGTTQLQQVVIAQNALRQK